MGLVESVLVLLLATGLSIPAARLSGAPLPLVQVVAGMALGLAGVEVPLEPDTFLLLFVPPLLFADAVRTPQREFLALGRPILALALGLVVFTTVAGGWAIHLLLPMVPLPACMTLAAVMSPTDTVAVSGMIGGAGPRRLKRVLEGEALLNDASGLVCFKFAMLATMTGLFSLPAAVLGFAVLSGVGLLTGALVAMVFGIVDRALIRFGIEDVVTQTALTMLLPFAVYLLADALAGSGILAAVAAGLVISRLRLLGQAKGLTRLQINALWRTVAAVFNGLIFLLLGLQLPALARSGLSAAAHAGLSAWQLAAVVTGIAGLLLLLRLSWVGAALLFGTAWSRIRGRPAPWPGLALTGAATVAGVRGAVTLAGILSLPVATATRSGFPERDLLIGIAAGVIILSLLLAALLLPWLMRNASVRVLSPLLPETDWLQAHLAEIAVAELRRRSLDAARPGAEGDMHAEVNALLLAEQTRKLDDRSSQGALLGRALARDRLETSERLRLLHVQRDELRRLIRHGDIPEEVEASMTELLDIEEVALLQSATALPHRIGGGRTEGSPG